MKRVLSEMPSDRDRQILFRFYIAEDEKDSICRDLDLTSLHFNRVLFRARERYRDLYLETAGSRKNPGGRDNAAPEIHVGLRWITRGSTRPSWRTAT